MEAALQAKADLALQGYAILENVLTPQQVATATQYFKDWLAANPTLVENHKKNDPHGIFKFAEVGHQKHAWYLKTLPEVQLPFQVLWDTPDLTTGFDGSCWIPPLFNSRDSIWTHTDQAPDTKGLTCVQGFVALTSNTQRTLVVYEGSHLLHAPYMADHGITGKNNWLLIDHAYLASIAHRKKVLTVPAGSLVLWDSRTFHQNQYGTPGEERLVQYVCFLPKQHPMNTPAMRKKRVKYFQERRTTSHWPYPLRVNGKQPQTYGDNTRAIDYAQLAPPDLTEFAAATHRLLN